MDRAGRDLAEAEPDAVLDEVAVHRVVHGLAEAAVVHRRLAQVEVEPHHLGEVLVALGGHLEMRQRLEARHLERLDVGKGRKMRLAGLHGDDAGA